LYHIVLGKLRASPPALPNVIGELRRIGSLGSLEKTVAVFQPTTHVDIPQNRSPKSNFINKNRKNSQSFKSSLIGRRRSHHSAKFKFKGNEADQNGIKSGSLQIGDTNQMEEIVWSLAATKVLGCLLL
jgi:hypothetical protein